MKLINQKILIKTYALTLAIFFIGFFLLPSLTGYVFAAPQPSNTGSASKTATSPPSGKYTCSDPASDSCLNNNPIIKWLNIFINIFMGIIGVGAVLALIIGGIQYITARDNPQAVADAKKRITNVVIGLAMFIFLYAFLQWLVPGGVFTN